MILINQSGGAKPGLVDVSLTSPVLDPGLKVVKAKNGERDFIGANPFMPDAIGGLVLGFEPMDGMVRVQRRVDGPNGQKNYQDEIIVIYDNNGAVHKAYQFKETPRGERYVEVGEKGVYEYLGIQDGVLKAALGTVAARAEDHFHPVVSRYQVYSALNTMERFVNREASRDGLYYAVRTFFQKVLGPNYASYRNRITPEIAGYVKKLLDEGLYVQAKTQTESDSFYVNRDKDGTFSKLMQSFYDIMKANGEEEKFVRELKHTAGFYADKDPRISQDMIIIAERLDAADSENLAALPIVVGNNGNGNNGEEKKEPESDAELSAKIQAIYDGADTKTKSDLLLILKNESGRRGRPAKEIEFYVDLAKAISSENPDQRLTAKPIETNRDRSMVTRDNAESISKRTQELYNLAGHDAKVSFGESVRELLLELEDGKYKDDIAMILSRVENDSPTGRLDAKPILGKQLIAQPTPSFFGYVKSIEAHRTAATMQDATDAVKDKFGIIESIAAKAGLLDDSISITALLGGMTAVYSPELDTVMLHDSRIVPTEGAFDKYKTFAATSIFHNARKALKSIKNNGTLSEQALADLKMPKEQAEAVAKLSNKDQKAAVMQFVFGMSKKYVNGKVRWPRPLVSNAILAEIATKEFDEQLDDNRFWGTAIHREREALFGGPKDLMKIDLVEKDLGRPRVKSGAGIPVELAEYMAPGYRKTSRIPRPEHFAVANFAKRFDAKKRDFGSGIDLESKAYYSLTNITTPTRAHFFSATKTLAEDIARHVQALKKCDNSGSFTYEVKNEGISELRTGTVDGAKEIQGLIDVLTKYSTRELGAGRTEAVARMLSDMVKAIGEPNKIAAAKAALFENDFGPVAELVRAATQVNTNRIYNVSTESYISLFNKGELDAAASRLSAAHATGNWGESRYIKPSGFDSARESEERTALSRMQYGMNRSMDLAEMAIEKLTQKGEAVLAASERGTNSRDGGTMPGIYYAPEFREAERMLSLLRDQCNMEVRDNRATYVPANPSDPFIRMEEIPETERIPGGQTKQLVVTPSMEESAKKRMAAFREEVATRSTDELLKNAMTQNSGPSRMNFSNLLNEIAYGTATAEAMPSADEIAAMAVAEEVGLPSSDAAMEVCLPEEIQEEACEPMVIADIDFTDDDFDQKVADNNSTQASLADMILSGGGGSLFGHSVEGDIGFDDDAASLFKNQQ